VKEEEGWYWGDEGGVPCKQYLFSPKKNWGFQQPPSVQANSRSRVLSIPLISYSQSGCSSADSAKGWHCPEGTRNYNAFRELAAMEGDSRMHS
jgi:hypothetical protein